MRQVVFAPSFDQEAEDIGVYIDERFGELARRNFSTELSRVCFRLAALPGLGTTEHGYPTKSVGFPFEQNWIFFDYDDDAAHFVHVVSTRRDKAVIPF